MKTPTSTIRDVARHAGVSVATISRFLNNASLLAPETAERVKQAMDDLNFTPHPVARNLATRKTNTIGLLLLDIGDNFYTPLLRGIEAVAGDAGYDLLIHTTGTNRGGQPLRRPLSEYNTDGLLVFINALDHRELTRLREIGFPVVLMNQSPPPGAYIPWVTIDNLDGARKIVEHMITVHNRKRIAFLSGPDGNEDSQHREEGYRIALHTHNIPFDPALVGKGNFN